VEEPEQAKEVAVSAWRLVVPDVWVILPPTVKLLSVPSEVRELLRIPEPRVVDDKT
jgi:hypothetical protein